MHGGSYPHDEVSRSIFTAGNELAIVATQSHIETAIAKFYVQGCRFNESDPLGKVLVSGECDAVISVRLPRHALLVTVFSKSLQ